MNRKRALILILILFTSLFPLIPIPIAKASSITVSISNSFDDVWMTEAGNIFSNTFMVMMLDDEIGIHSFLRFQNIAISKSAKINYATLKIYVAETQETPDPGSSVTIYGIDEPDCAPFTSDGSLWSLSRPYTSASVNWNTTEWSGYRSVNVTDIVKEIVNQYAWSSGNDLGLQILGVTDSGQSPRSFEDYYHMYHEGQAQLTIVYDVIDEPPETEWEFEEQYDEYTIWRIPGDVLYDYVFTEGTESPYNLMYANIGKGETTLISQSENQQVSSFSTQRNLIHLSDGTIYVAYFKQLAGQYQIYVIKSLDGGDNWIDDTRISNYTGMIDYGQFLPAMAVDSNDSLHVVWYGMATGFNTANQIWYALYNGSWQTPVRISTYANMGTHGCAYPSIAVDSNDYLHVVMQGKATGFTSWVQTWYSKYTVSWSQPLRISTLAGMEDSAQQFPTVEIDSNNYVHVLWEGAADDPPIRGSMRHRKYTDSWGPILIVSTGDVYDDNNYKESVVVDSEDNLHAVWYNMTVGSSDNQICYNVYNNISSTWGTETTIISTYPGMEDLNQNGPSIAIDSNESLHVIWYGQATADGDKIWYSFNNGSWIGPAILQSIGQNVCPSLRWSRWPIIEYEEEDDIYIVTDENDTIIPSWNGENCTSLECIENWIDDNLLNGGDPLDPDPGTQGWATEGPFTRFNMRLYFLFIGLGCIFAPLWAMAYKKFDTVGYTWCFLIMVLGVGLLWSITGI